MENLREISWKILRETKQDMVQSNQCWDRRAEEFSHLSGKGDDGYLEFLTARADLVGASVLDVGSGAGRYLKKLLDLGAKAEGLEPSSEMRAVSKEYLMQLGYREEEVVLHAMGFSALPDEKQYDYLFIANNPMLSFQENYAKVFQIARKGIFIGSGLEHRESLLEAVSQRLDRRQDVSSNDLFYAWVNLAGLDGYEIDFSIKTRIREEAIRVDDVLHRYASWLYTSNYDEEQLEKARAALLACAETEECNRMERKVGMLYIPLPSKPL